MVSEQASPFLPNMSFNNLCQSVISSANIRLDDNEKKDTDLPTSTKKPLFNIQPVKIVLLDADEIMVPKELQEVKPGDVKFAEDEDDDKNILIIQFENWLCCGNFFFKQFKNILINNYR